jgi:hypothetical protein
MRQPVQVVPSQQTASIANPLAAIGPANEPIAIGSALVPLTATAAT